MPMLQELKDWRPLPPQKFQKKSWKGHYCISPFAMVQILLNGQVRLCGCGFWMPTTVGNVFENTLEEILAGAKAQEVRQSIIDGTYEFCNEKMCGVILNNGLNTIDTLPSNIASLLDDSAKYIMPYEISVHGDRICNLSCPSCRTHVIKHSEEEAEHLMAVGELLYKNVFSKPTEQRVRVMISGSGEVFASPMLMNFLSKINTEHFPNIALDINTNGLMAEKNWHCVAHLEKNIHKITISVDACRKETYEVLRRGGTWEKLLSSMEFLQQQRAKLGCRFNARMIVQQENYQQAEEFYHWCKKYQVDKVEYSQCVNWGTWTAEEFARRDIFDPNHHEHEALCKVVKQLRAFPDSWFEGMAV